MHINILAIFLIIVFACLAWWVAHQFTLPPILVRIVEVIIVVASVLALLSAFGIGPGISITAG